MPYRSNGDLADSVRRHLPPHAQDIDREGAMAKVERAKTSNN